MTGVDGRLWRVSARNKCILPVYGPQRAHVELRLPSTPASAFPIVQSPFSAKCCVANVILKSEATETSTALRFCFALLQKAAGHMPRHSPSGFADRRGSLPSLWRDRSLLLRAAGQMMWPRLSGAEDQFWQRWDADAARRFGTEQLSASWRWLLAVYTWSLSNHNFSPGLGG